MARRKRACDDRPVNECDDDEDDCEGVPAMCSTADELSESEPYELHEERGAAALTTPWAGTEEHEAYSALVARALRDPEVACVFPVQLHAATLPPGEDWQSLTDDQLARSSAVHASLAVQLHADVVAARVRGRRASDDAFRTLRCTVPHRCRPGCVVAIKRASAEAWRPTRVAETRRNDVVYTLAMHALEQSRRWALSVASHHLQVSTDAIRAVVEGRDPIIADERERFALRVSESAGAPVPSPEGGDRQTARGRERPERASGELPTASMSMPSTAEAATKQNGSPLKTKTN